MQSSIEATLDPGAMDVLDQWAQRLSVASSRWDRVVHADPTRLLTQRADALGLGPQGRLSAGGKTRLLPAADGWVAVSLPRDDDVDMLPAWLGCEMVGLEWNVVEDAIRARESDGLVQQGRSLGLAVSRLPRGIAPSRLPFRVARPHRAAAEPGGARRPVRRPLVADFSSLWAGPLCAHLLTEAGAHVIKIESSRRPDGARATPAFFDPLHRGQEALTVDFRSGQGRARLKELVRSADIVIEASRPRAFAQLGLEPAQFLRARAGMTWISITAYGRTGPGASWIGFGDDVAVAAGLVGRDDSGSPCFMGDAIADPVSGLAAALAAMEHHGGAESRLLDVAMVRAARVLAARIGN